MRYAVTGPNSRERMVWSETLNDDGQVSQAHSFTEADRRALFRHFRDPARLRRNPLARRFFAEPSAGLPRREADERGLFAVREAVETLAERLRRVDLRSGLKQQAERYFQAIVRCDISREPCEVVASDLGISPRHFRRVRRVAQQRIADALWGDGEVAIAVLLDVAVLELAMARGLWEGGNSAAAVDLLTSVASSASDVRHRVRASVDLVNVLVKRAHLNEAEKILVQANDTLARSDLSRAEAETCGSLVLLAQSTIEFGRQNQQAGRDHEDAALSRMAENGVGVDILTREVFARGLLNRAERKNVWGWFHASNKDLDQVARLEADAIPLPISLVVERLILVGDAVLGVAGYDAAGYVALKRALSLAQAHGLGRRAVIAARELADMQYERGRAAEAEELMRFSLGAAQSLGMPDLIIEAALFASELAFRRRNWETQQSHLDLARRSANGGTVATRLELGQADCFLLRGEAARCLRHAVIAERTAATLKNERLRGAALRRIAQAQSTLGARLDARKTVEKMVPILERYGGKRSLALGYQVAAQIMGNAEYKKRAAEIFV